MDDMSTLPVERVNGRSPLIGRGHLLFALALIAGAWFLHTTWRNKTVPFEQNAVADVSWVVAGPPRSIRCLVLAQNGEPLSGKEVRVHNSSGFQSATSGGNGWANLGEMGEPEVNAITVNDIEVMSRPTYFGDLKPRCTNGLVVTIVIKDPKLITASTR